MTGTELSYILPENYQQWTVCFEMIEKGEITDGQIEMLKKGRCDDFAFCESYFYVQLEKTVNLMLNKSIKNFKRNIRMNELYPGEGMLSLQFRRMIKDCEKCLFFTQLQFLNEEYRQKLFQSVQQETQKFLHLFCESLYEQCIRENGQGLYDEIRLIKRIKPYREWEKIGV